ncbi:hypothetical protein NZ698_09755 [Chryseobacterium sp. PBS4-4]|uniref:Uncharacterized protein n=1 Tax=Chryseobacterium edaphi TaxID=2976532 RepID=A0ABT2W674_9FLAO|nr:hypothetical protein [Chryseobacterium edaphi]MCU7617483.1 hypothetical protein [Chryseobacterium edaphi]
MAWNVELGKQISMVILVIMMILIAAKYKKIEKVNLFFFAGYILLSLNDFFFYFFTKFTNLLTEKYYSVCIAIVFLMYLIYYYKLMYIPLLKKIQRIILVLFFVNIFGMSILEHSFFQGLSFNIFYINILLLIFSIILFLYQTFNSDKIFEIKNYLPFWISVGSLIFYIGIIPLFFFRVKVSTDIFAIVIFLLNLINNGLIVFGIFWNKPDEVKQT